jgi:hypothetical protein
MQLIGIKFIDEFHAICYCIGLGAETTKLYNTVETRAELPNMCSPELFEEIMKHWGDSALKKPSCTCEPLNNVMVEKNKI